jgi:hypothetical protein
MSDAARLISPEKRGGAGAVNDARQQVDQAGPDSSKWTGRRGRIDPGSARILIALIYAFIGPVIGAFVYMAFGMVITSAEPFNPVALVYFALVSSLFFIPHASGFIPALIAGLAVGYFASNRRHSFLAAWAAPAALYGLLFLTGDFFGARLTFGGSPPFALPLIALPASLTCWLLTLPLQRQT